MNTTPLPATAKAKAQIHDKINHILQCTVDPNVFLNKNATNFVLSCADSFASTVAQNAQMLANSRRGVGSVVQEEDVRDFLKLSYGMEEK